MAEKTQTMVLPITKIEDFKLKSWKEMSNLNTIDFSQINIIFGHNGAGKTSLARGIVEAYKKGGHDIANARFFSSKYIDSTLLLEDKTGIRGVISNFGKKDIEAEKKIRDNKTKIDQLKNDISKLTTERNITVANTEEEIKQIVARRKDKNKKINNKPDNKTLEEKIQLWIDDYEKAVREFPKEDYNAITGNADFSAESELVNNLELPEMPVVDSGLVEAVKAILSKKYEDVEIPETTVVEWLESGLTIHEHKTKCEFCGGNLSIAAIQKKVDAFVNNEKHQAVVGLKRYRETLGALAKIAQKIADDKDKIISAIELDKKEVNIYSAQELAASILDVVNGVILEKLKGMNSGVQFDDKKLSVDIDKLMELIEKLNKAKKERTRKINEKINRLETLVKGAIGFEIKNSVQLEGCKETIKTQNRLIKQGDDKKKMLEETNNKLLIQKSDLADFAYFLNSILKDINLDFRLELSGKYYILKHIDNTALKLSDISDGERNLLALIYFYYEMLEDSSGKFKDTIQLAIIDDPIPSLDDNNKFYITEIIKSIFNQNSIQVFTLTHSWDDFCNLSYGVNEDKTAIFEIRKATSNSNIYSIGTKKLLKPYIMLYREVYRFSKIDLNKITDDEALHMPNTIRRILEEYVKFRVDVDFEAAAKNGEISKALFSKELCELSKIKSQKLSVLLSVCNVLSHKANQPKNPSEIHDSAKFLMNSLEENDKYHHLKMRGDD
jgi:wobble nucleotide-excising tRNase